MRKRPLRPIHTESRPLGCDYSVGAALWDPVSNQGEYAFDWVHSELISTWANANQHIAKVELVTLPLALATWAAKLRGRQVLICCDNSGAAGARIKGYNPQADCAQLAGLVY